MLSTVVLRSLKPLPLNDGWTTRTLAFVASSANAPITLLPVRLTLLLVPLVLRCAITKLASSAPAPVWLTTDDEPVPNR